MNGTDSWTKVESQIIAKIKVVENVDRAEAIRRMQRRKDTLHLRGASDVQLETNFKKFIRHEERSSREVVEYVKKPSKIEYFNRRDTPENSPVGQAMKELLKLSPDLSFDQARQMINDIPWEPSPVKRAKRAFNTLA